jgi:hypothetical protein
MGCGLIIGYISHFDTVVTMLYSLLLHMHAHASVQWWMFPFLWVPELSPWIRYQLLRATAHKDWTTAVLSLTHQPTRSAPLHSTALHCSNWTVRVSQSYFMTSSLLPISSPWYQAPWGSQPEFFFFATEPYSHSPHESSSLIRGWVCFLWIGFAFVKCTYRTYSIGLHGYRECLFFPGSGQSNRSDNM